MCGIFARIAPISAPPRDIVPVRHRGPDASGLETLEIAEQRITLAHWRLGIIDIRECSNQPFRRRPRGPIIVFNGEIYNYIELRSRLGGDFLTSGDTEVLLAAYEKWGTACLNYLRGMFAFVIVDPERRLVFAARDRFAIKPLYWHRSGQAWEFASEIKQIVGHAPKINNERVKDFLFYGAQDHTAETMFDGIMQLRGGQSLTIDLEQLQNARLETWYEPRSQETFRGDFEQASRAVREMFFETVSIHLRSDAPLGFCLSGGMDSSALICTAGALLQTPKQPITGINCRFSEAGFDEYRFALDAAQISGANLLTTNPDVPSLLHDLEKITYFQDEPLNNPSLLSQYSVFKMARDQRLKVMIDGQGGDELLASYPQFFGPYLLGLLGRFKIRSFFEESSHFRQDHAWGLMDTFQSLSVWFAPRFVFRTARHFARGFAKNKWAKREFLFGNGVPMPPWQSPDRMETNATTRSMSLLMLQQLSLPMLLHWEDRNSMAHSVESRVPFLDHNLVELVLSLPDEFKIYRGVTKRILKAALRDLIPPSIIARRDKLGFATPGEKWMRDGKDEFSILIQDAAACFPDIFNPAGLMQTWQFFLSGGPFQPVLWRIAMLSVWARVFNLR
jgi:asparagine synthase (glutamine-hydrolysing)